MALSEKHIGFASPTPGYVPEIEGAPASISGSGSGKPITQMSGTPVATATIPPAVSADLEGAPNSGQTVTNPIAPPATEPTEVKVSTDVETKGEEEAKDVPTTDTDAPSTATVTDNNNPDTTGSDRKIKTLQDMIDTFEPQETAEQRKKRERREKSAKIISAVSDGLRAMSNLYFTSQYAPDMYNHEKSSQLNAQNAAIEKARKDREANRDAHLKFALALGDAENERAKTVREWEAEQERRKLAREKAERERKKEEAERALDPFRQGKAKAEQEYWEHKAETGKAESENAPEYYKGRNKLTGAKIQTEQTKQKANVARANDSNASAAKHRSDMNKGKGFNVEDADGKVRYIDNNDLDREFSALPDEKRTKAGNKGSMGSNKPTSEQKRQAIAEHERTLHRRNYKGKLTKTSELGL